MWLNKVTPQICGISEVLNKNGWKIRGLSKTVLKKHGQWTVEASAFDRG
jgi:hypothetical protein